MFGGIPFAQFAQDMPRGGGGGMPNGRGGGEAADTTKLYETLEIEKTATQKEIKKSYFRLSKVHHPDKGGDEHKFKEINAAYEILSDPEKREKYDKYGLEGVNDGHNYGGGEAEDLFSMFFGGGRRRSEGPKKSPSLNHPIKVSLEDLYNGKTVKLAINRKVVVGEAKVCSSCKGHGMRVEVRQIGPGMVTQVQRQCPDCGGQGNIAKTKSERKVLEVQVEKGMEHNDKITFRGMADELPNMEAGDVHFVVQQKEHDLFKRKGADLLCTKDVSLNQALTGFSWKVKHLDGRDLMIKTRPGQVIQCETTDEQGRTLPFIMLVKDEGMPSRGNPFVRGNLYIAFHVKFPETLGADVIAAIRTLLPGANVEEDYDPAEVEEHFLEIAELKHFGKGGAVTANNEYDSDDEGGRGGAQPVQCQQS